MALLILIASASFADADTPSFQFGGERFLKKFEVATSLLKAQCP